MFITKYQHDEYGYELIFRVLNNIESNCGRKWPSVEIISKQYRVEDILLKKNLKNLLKFLSLCNYGLKQ